ncbi:AAC(3) family N-acetyltransferase [Campylobacter sp. 9BO]|uniref:AAC(3) family N-acetyltransferase n=1 Tax=Campylobacter sp. 9BO TaxID=3424759 RepID=UPI003D34547F
MKELLSHANGIITNHDICEMLENLGLKKGDHVCVHSELFTLGVPLLKKDEFLSEIIKCFWQIIGKNGVLIMPTFTYSFCKNLPFDNLKTPSTMGVLTEFFRLQNKSLRSNDPIFSFTISGKNAKEYINDCKSCFGVGSVYDILFKNSGKILHFGNAYKGFTFSHFLEEKLNIPYRYFKEFSGELIDENGIKQHKNILYFVRRLADRSILSVEKNVKILTNANNFKVANLGGGNVSIMECKKYHDAIKSALQDDKFALVI